MLPCKSSQRAATCMLHPAPVSDLDVLNIWNCNAEACPSQLTVCIVFAPLHFSHCCGFLDMLRDHYGNDQDISEVHPSIKGGDIWPKMISMKQQESNGNIGTCCLNNFSRCSLTCELIQDILHMPFPTIQRHLS